MLNYIKIVLFCELPPAGWPVSLPEWPSHLKYDDYEPWVSCRLHATLAKYLCTQSDINDWDAGLNPIHSVLNARPNIDITKRTLDKCLRRSRKFEGRKSLCGVRPLICYAGGPWASWGYFFQVACCPSKEEQKAKLIDNGSVHLSVDCAWLGTMA